MFKRFFSFIKSIFISAKAVNIVSTEQEKDVIPVPVAEVQEVRYFTRKNNLVEEFYSTPQILYSSNLENTEPIGAILSDGTMVYDKKFIEQEILNEAAKEEILPDDVSLVPDIDKCKPEIPKSVTFELQQNKTYITGVDPYKETMLRKEDIHIENNNNRIKE